MGRGMAGQERREQPLRGCPQCRQSFRGREGAEYCSDRCRTKAWRQRKAQGQGERNNRLQSLVKMLAREVGLRVEDSE